MKDVRTAAAAGLRRLIKATKKEPVVIGGRQFEALVSPADEEAKALAGMQIHERGLKVRIDFSDTYGQPIGLKDVVQARGEDWRIAGILPSTVGPLLTLKALKN